MEYAHENDRAAFRLAIRYEYPCGESNEHIFIGKESCYLSADGDLMPARNFDQP